MRVSPKTAGTFRQIVNERGAILRTMSRDELLAARDQPTEHLTVENRSTTISLIVESKPDGSLRVVVQGFMKALIGYYVAMDGFYKRPDGSVTPMPEKEFYEFD